MYIHRACGKLIRTCVTDSAWVSVVLHGVYKKPPHFIINMLDSRGVFGSANNTACILCRGFSAIHSKLGLGTLLSTRQQTSLQVLSRDIIMYIYLNKYSCRYIHTRNLCIYLSGPVSPIPLPKDNCWFSKTPLMHGPCIARVCLVSPRLWRT